MVEEHKEDILHDDDNVPSSVECKELKSIKQNAESDQIVAAESAEQCDSNTENKRSFKTAHETDECCEYFHALGICK